VTLELHCVERRVEKGVEVVSIERAAKAYRVEHTAVRSREDPLGIIGEELGDVPIGMIGDSGWRQAAWSRPHSADAVPRGARIVGPDACEAGHTHCIRSSGRYADMLDPASRPGSPHEVGPVDKR